MQTLARDFTVKLYGKASYKGLTSEQVLTGWFFYYDDWKEEPCIRIKSNEVRSLLGVGGKFACLKDFFGTDGYKLGDGMQYGTGIKDNRGVSEANEKFSLISMVVSGSVWKIFPYVDSDTPGRNIAWYSLTDRFPVGVSAETGVFMRSSMNYVAEQVAHGDFRQVETLVDKIRAYQVREGGDYLPSHTRFQAEICYNRLNDSRPLAMLALALGFLSFVLYGRWMVRGRFPARWWIKVLFLFMVLLSFRLLLTIGLRGFVSGHMPMSNGHETMQLMAFFTTVIALILHRRMPVSLSFGFLLCGFSLLVSMMGETNPQITQLVPVLSSPLLSLHVTVIMIAYTLLAFIMLNGVTALVIYLFHPEDSREQTGRLQIISRLLLYPAVFLLAIGIFIGAVWANVSWGRYWGWDPKEVWALITMLVYALALHPASIGCFRRPMFFHLYVVMAFLCVLVTYFGVNFILGGMHSYA